MDLVPPLAEMVPDDVRRPAPEDLTIRHPLWNERAEQRFTENTTRNAYLEAWRSGAMGSVETLYALIEHDALDFEHTLQLIADHALISSRLVSPVELPASSEGRVG